jgi:hypothetical protein
VTFSLFWAQETHFCIGRHENKEKRLFYFGPRILIANPNSVERDRKTKTPKIDSPYYAMQA